MSNRDPRPATGTQPTEPTEVHAEDPSREPAACADAHVDRFVRALEPDGSSEDEAAAVRLLVDMLHREHRAAGYPETSARGRAMNRRILGRALDLGVLTEADLEWAERYFADVVVIRRRVRRPGFAPMGLRCAIVVEGERGVVGLVRGRGSEDDEVVYAPLEEFAVERSS